MDVDVQVMLSGDQEMYGRRCESQPAISAVRTYVCIGEKKYQKLKSGYYMNLKPNRFSAPNKKASLTLCLAL